MNAPRRKQSQRMVWLRPRTAPDPPAPFKGMVLTYPDAKPAFDKLTRAGLDEDLLWRHLWGLACLEKPVNRKQRSPWYTPDGWSPHTLRRFPKRVGDMADEIEGLNKKDPYNMPAEFFCAMLAQAIPGTSLEREFGGKLIREEGTAVPGIPVTLARGLLRRRAELPKLAELPDLLRVYADYIEAMSRLTARHAPKGAALLHRNMPQELVRLVKVCTGRPHDEEVATLLTASYQAIGCTRTASRKALAMQRSRSRKK